MGRKRKRSWAVGLKQWQLEHLEARDLLAADLPILPCTALDPQQISDRAFDTLVASGESNHTVVIVNPGVEPVDPHPEPPVTAQASNDPPFRANVTIAKTSDSSEPTTNGQFALTMSEASETDTIVQYEVLVASTGTNGTDFQTLPGTATILAGATASTIDVTVIDDELDEGTETILVRLVGTNNPSVTVLESVLVPPNGDQTAPAFSPGIQFDFLYEGEIGPGGIGFEDPAEGQTRRDALEAAARQFGMLFDHSATIQVSVSSTDQPNSNTLASAGSGFVGVFETGFGKYSIIRNKILNGNDLNNSGSDGIVNVNWGQNWHIGADPSAIAFNQSDFFGTMFHEFAHLVGISANILQDGRDGFGTAVGQPGRWNEFTRYFSDAAGNEVVNESTAILNQSVWETARFGGASPDSGLFFDGPNAVAANGGELVGLFSPGDFAPGSSWSHLDGDNPEFSNFLMLAASFQGTATRNFSPIGLGVFQDLGYSLTAPEIIVMPTAGDTVVSESGTFDAIFVSLATAPTADVTLNVVPANPAEISTQVNTLTFEAHEWNIPQAVYVRGVEDGVASGDSISAVQFSVNDAASADAFDGLTASVNVTNLDASATKSAAAMDIVDNDAPVPRTIANQSGGTVTLVTSANVGVSAYDYQIRTVPINNSLTTGSLVSAGHLDLDEYTVAEQTILEDKISALVSNHTGETAVLVNHLSRVDLFAASDVSLVNSIGTAQDDRFALVGLGDAVDVFDLNGGDGQDMVSIDHSSFVSGDTHNVTATQLEVVGKTRLDYSGIEDLTLATGAGNDVVTVSSVYLNDLATTRIITNAGDDNVTVAAPDGNGDPSHLALADPNARRLSVSTGAGFDTVDAGTASLAVHMSLGDDHDIGIGGAGDDFISGDNGDDFLVGDRATITRSGLAVTQVASDPSAAGGNDEIWGRDGRDYIIAGGGNDRVFTNQQADYVIADHGTFDFEIGDQLVEMSSTSAIGGDDLIITDAGNDFIIAGPGNDVAGTGSDSGNDVFIGDLGRLQFGANGTLIRAETVSPEVAGNDSLFAQDGNDIALGGSGDDLLNVGADDVRDSGRDIAIGDNGLMLFDQSGVMTQLQTVGVLGGIDRIIAGGGPDVIVGGAAGDTLQAGGDKDVVFGDFANLTFDANDWLRLEAIELVSGGNDTLSGAGDNDVLVGGAAADVVVGNLGDDILIGDNAILLGGSDAENPHGIMSLSEGGGDDRFGEEGGQNIIIGGGGSDNLLGASQRDWIAGDYADVRRDNTLQVTEFASSHPSIGDADVINSRHGDDIVLAGIGNDVVTGSNGRDVVFGDAGQVLSESGQIFRLSSLPSVAGGDDQIFGETGNDIVIGGPGNDLLDGGSSGNDVLLGDDATANITTLLVTRVSTGTPSTTPGGNDEIIGGSGFDILVGGGGEDTVAAGTEVDIAVGDDVIMGFDSRRRLQSLQSITSVNGGVDFMTAEGTSNLIVGGEMNDTIQSGDGDDTLVGDQAIVLASRNRITRIFGVPQSSVGDDSISTTGGNNTVVGGKGNDQLRTGNGNDLIVGDYSDVRGPDGTVNANDVLADAVGLPTGGDNILTSGGKNVILGGGSDDVIQGGNGEDYIIGDEATIFRTSSNAVARMESVIRDGALGDDEILSGNGISYVIGGVGDDEISGGSDQDFVVGDAGRFVFWVDGANSAINALESIDGPVGNDFMITGDGIDYAIGGNGPDVFGTGASNEGDFAIGDQGIFLFDSTSTLRTAETRESAQGGIDLFFTQAGADIVFGGSGGDNIVAGANAQQDTSRDIVLGDDGVVQFDSLGVAISATTVPTAFGGADAIRTGGAQDAVLGGPGLDSLNVGNEQDVVVPDDGSIDLTNL